MILSMLAMTINLEMNSAPWRPVNDGVMGGVSSGRMLESEGKLRFEGQLSLENNGGFASVRRQVDQDLSKTTAVRLELRGDGRTYQFRLRQDSGFDGVAWRAEFSTSGEWQTVELSFDQFIPVFRGRRVSQAGPLEPSKILQAGFMLADKTPGAFALEIRSIGFLDSANP